MKKFYPVGGAVVLAALWFVLAWRSPTSTHHFAPFVVAAAWGFLATPTGRNQIVTAAVGGTAVASATAVSLLIADRLQGPTLWGARPSWPELLGFAALGGLLTVMRAGRSLLAAEPVAPTPRP